jgi:hypothetical protein
MNYLYKSWTGIKMNFWPLVYPCPSTTTFLTVSGYSCSSESVYNLSISKEKDCNANHYPPHTLKKKQFQSLEVTFSSLARKYCTDVQIIFSYLMMGILFVKKGIPFKLLTETSKTWA